jgi:hypothetical protein
MAEIATRAHDIGSELPGDILMKWRARQGLGRPE